LWETFPRTNRNDRCVGEGCIADIDCVEADVACLARGAVGSGSARTNSTGLSEVQETCAAIAWRKVSR
jgi:hypothetical protein